MTRQTVCPLRNTETMLLEKGLEKDLSGVKIDIVAVLCEQTIMHVSYPVFFFLATC